ADVEDGEHPLAVFHRFAGGQLELELGVPRRTDHLLELTGVRKPIADAPHAHTLHPDRRWGYGSGKPAFAPNRSRRWGSARHAELCPKPRASAPQRVRLSSRRDGPSAMVAARRCPPREWQRLPRFVRPGRLQTGPLRLGGA